MSTEFQVTFDAGDPDALCRFWIEALDYQMQPPPPGFDTWDAFLESVGVPEDQRNTASAALPREGESGPRLFFQQVPEGKTAKNRVHLDLRKAVGLENEERMTALEAEAERLVALGATRLERFEPGSGLSAGHIVMQDPEGNEFCLD